MAVISVRYFAIRTLQSIFLLWVLVTALFFFFLLMPGDFTSVMMISGAEPEAVEQFRNEWGLNDPLYIQYFDYMANLIQGDVGISTQTRQPVLDYVWNPMFNSFILIAPSITIGYLLGSAYGVVAGINRGSWIEKHGVVPLFFIGAFPSFFLAIVMVVVFAGWLDLFPTSGLLGYETRNMYVDAAWWRVYFTRDFLWHYALPFGTIVLRYLFFPSLVMRTSVIEVRNEGFNYYHRITGIPKLKRYRQMAKHASLPVITLYPISMVQAIGGLVLVEIVFNWPGIGFALVQAVFARDFPVLMFVFFVIGVFIIVANFVVDILYSVIDPRVSVE
jgi:peptide/nickel transport system permease protein